MPIVYIVWLCRLVTTQEVRPNEVWPLICFGGSTERACVTRVGLSAMEGPGGAEGSVASAQTETCHAGTEAALSNAAALGQSKFGIGVLQPEAVRPRELHSPSDGTRQSPATLTASADRARSCYSWCVRRCRSCFLDAVFVRQRISSRWFLVSGLVSRLFNHSTARPGAHLHIITPIHPSLPNAPVLVASRTFCCDSNFRCPTGDRRVLARVISALTAIAVDQAPSDTCCTKRSMTALLRAFLPTEVNAPQQT